MTELSSALALAATQHGVLSRAQAVECGLTPHAITSLVRGGDWRRLRPGVYLTRREIAPALAARTLAAQIGYGPRAIAAGRTAARLWGMQGLVPGPGYDTVHLVVPRAGAVRKPGLHLHAWPVGAAETTLRGGIRVTTPGRTLRDTVLMTDRHSAVSLIDSALNQGLVHRDDLAELEAANAARRGAGRSRSWWAQADGRAQSTFETRLRIICADAAIPPEELQYPVVDAEGRVAGHADLAWPSRGVAVEADGAGPHSLPEALFVDRLRQNRVVTGAGRLILLRFAWRDLHRPRDIVEMIRAAHDRAGP